MVGGSRRTGRHCCATTASATARSTRSTCAAGIRTRCGCSREKLVIGGPKRLVKRALGRANGQRRVHPGHRAGDPRRTEVRRAPRRAALRRAAGRRRDRACMTLRRSRRGRSGRRPSRGALRAGALPRRTVERHHGAPAGADRRPRPRGLPTRAGDALRRRCADDVARRAGAGRHDRPRNLTVRSSAARVFRRVRPDVVHVHTPSTSGLTKLALAARLARVRLLVVTLHQVAPDALAWRNRAVNRVGQHLFDTTVAGVGGRRRHTVTACRACRAGGSRSCTTVCRTRRSRRPRTTPCGAARRRSGPATSAVWPRRRASTRWSRDRPCSSRRTSTSGCSSPATGTSRRPAGAGEPAGCSDVVVFTGYRADARRADEHGRHRGAPSPVRGVRTRRRRGDGGRPAGRGHRRRGRHPRDGRQRTHRTARALRGHRRYNPPCSCGSAPISTSGSGDGP